MTPLLGVFRESGAHKAIHADALLRRSNGQGTVRFRRHPNHELPAVAPVRYRLGNRLAIGPHVGHAVGHEASDAGQCLSGSRRQPAQRRELGAKVYMNRTPFGFVRHSSRSARMTSWPFEGLRGPQTGVCDSRAM